MAAVARTGTPSLATRLPDVSCQVGSGLVAGVAIAAFDACYIHSDGTVRLSNGTAADTLAEVDGYAAHASASGEPVTLLEGIDVRYGAGLTPGTKLYLSAATAGALADAATTGGSAPIGKVLDATRVRLWASRY